MLLPHAVMLCAVTALYTGGPPWNTDLPSLMPITEVESLWVTDRAVEAGKAWLAANFTSPAPAARPVTDNDVARAIANAGGGLRNLPFPTDADIAKSIERAKVWLLAQQKEDGLWPGEAGPDGVDPCGTTAMAFEAVLVCGLYPHPFYENKKMAAALDALVAAKPEETRAVALRCLALVRAFGRCRSPVRRETPCGWP